MKLSYRLLGMLLGVLGGALGGVVFTRIWKWTTGQDEAPKATAGDHGWREVLIAAAVEGAIFGVVGGRGPCRCRGLPGSHGRMA